MTTVQPGQVVEVDGFPYLVLGKTKTEYEVGTKVLVECEHLTIDPVKSTVEIKGVEIVGRGNGQAVDTLMGLLPSDESVKSRHSRSRCMTCKAPPAIDVQWADGRGRAWFCQKCFRPWTKEEGNREIIRAFHLPDGEVPKKIGDNKGTQLRKMGSNIPAGAIADRLDEIIATTWMRDEKGYISVIIALVPHLPVATRLVQSTKGALPVKDLHVTLVHLGKARTLAPHRATIEDILTEISSVTPPIRYKVGGHGRFLGVADDGIGDAVYASVDSPQIPDLYNKLSQAMEAAGIEVSKSHGFTPHITLAYTEDKEWTPDIKPLYGVADRIVLFWAGEQKGFNLRGSVGYVRKRQGKKARWVTIRGHPALIARPVGAGSKATKLPKAGGRWRTLRDGRHVYITKQEDI